MLSTSLSQKKYSKVSLGAFAVLLIIAVCSVWLVWQRQYVIDQLAVWQYEPSEEVNQIVKRAQLTSEGQFYLYASRTQVSDAAAFNQHCKKAEEHSAILGCYTGRQIYVYDVENKQLDGIKEVTAVHEMLHAAWDRLGEKEQSELAVLLEAEYAKHSTSDFEERMAYYARTQPGERANELHSIIGTEMADINSELEQYYKRYLVDRTKIVKLHETYRAVFVHIQSETTRLEAELSSLAKKIDSSTKTYNQAITELNDDIQAFNNRASGGGFTTQAEFAQQRATLVSRAASLESDRLSIMSSIDRYKDFVVQLEKINSQSSALTRSIDSTLNPAAKI